MEKQELSGIQYLRGLAAMSVVVYHLSMQSNWLNPSSVVLETLQSGVDIFFVISGYIMFYSTDGGTNLTPFEFFKRRIIRIVPLYWAVTLTMVLVLLVAPELIKQSVLNFWHAVASLAFVPTLNPATTTNYTPLVAPGWTLNFEMFFYLIFALGMTFGGKNRVRILAIVILPILILSSVGLALQPPGVLGVYTNPVMLEFAFGMLIAYATENTRPQQARHMYLAFFVLLLALFFLPMWSTLFRSFRFGLIASLIVTIAVRLQWPRSGSLHLLGNASYSIYLTHFFVLSGLSQLWRRLGLATDQFSELPFYFIGIVSRAGPGCLNRFSASISGTSAGVRLPSGLAAG